METKEATRATTPQEKKAMKFLNGLRNSGVTNMYGATPYIVEEFDVDKIEARRILTLWMGNFDEKGNYDQVKI